jgi:hypothetical protein
LRATIVLDLSDRTRIVYRGVIERWLSKFGKAKVPDLEPRQVADMMAEMLPHRTAANMLPKRLPALMPFAIRQRMAELNPVTATKPYKVEGTGFDTWTEDEIAQWEARHPVSTKTRLAFDLMLWTGQRGCDARVMGPQHVKNKRLLVSRRRRARLFRCQSSPRLRAQSLRPDQARWCS